MSEALHPAIAAGRVAVITGAASGIGLAAAYRLGAEGMRLVIADISEAGLEAAAEALRADSLEVRAVPTDVSDSHALEALRDEANGFGEVSLLMNNAGREGGGGIMAGAEVWERTIATN
jgi:NAD(P)-dependent dehydrogenase (short-subunit alcohol dehydrogenase family)